MERKDFLKTGLGFLGVSSVIAEACKKSAGAAATTTTTSGSCIVAPTEEEGPFPYPGGEITNPLDRSDVTGGQTGIPLTLNFTVVNVNDDCALVQGARVDIWCCNKDGYYSGYSNQNGGTSGVSNSYAGATWLRGYQTTGVNGVVTFTTIYPGWYQGRATHIHMEIFVNSVLKKQTQVAFPETISDAVHVTSLYAAHGTNTTRNATDSVFGNSATDLANETLSLAGDINNGYAASYTIGLAL